ncbi:biliverdin-producing heme oxygenase [Chelativorans sp. AA-79]|uniref:biliverdin-producing heme oxygenase n=1 Tax=Chelativorans sp. AA-79 TaxID=3028735 RepID=UPI0023FA232F|nr:biliverdin-producing heme oxygenase [Chelativorans sp. AA-79]WEX08522.1 biliverdin-producing heme oxygenase [Chelativorans sp. AA-79]
MNVVNLEDASAAGEFSRSKRLKQMTHEAHDRLDKRIMAAEPFSTQERYYRFLELQYRFHAEIDPLYRYATLAQLLPDLEARRRLGLIRQDMRDLRMSIPSLALDTDYEIDVPNALGWLYVAEGSNLGAAFLLKQAARLGLSETLGARHLAGHPHGRGLHWRRFTAALDAVDLSSEEEARVVEGATSAFRRVHVLVDEVF